MPISEIKMPDRMPIEEREDRQNPRAEPLPFTATYIHCLGSSTPSETEPSPVFPISTLIGSHAALPMISPKMAKASQVFRRIAKQNGSHL